MYKDPNFEPWSNLSDDKRNQFQKWLKLKRYLQKNIVKVTNLKEKRIYVDTLSVSSVKRSCNRLCERIFKSRSSGYEKFLSDEEKRLNLATDLALVEGVY